MARRSAPEIGTAVHAGLAVLHAEGGTVEKALEVAQAKIAERAGIESSFEDKSLEESLSIINPLLQGYAEHWESHDDMWAPLSEEIQFLVEVGVRTGVYLRGRADNLSMMKGGLWLIDYKTAARMDPRDLLKYEMDLQLTAYIYGLSKQLTADSLKEGGEPVEVLGAVIDLLVKTKVPQYAREVYTRTPDELAEFEAEFVEYGSRIRSAMQRIKAGEDWKVAFPRNTEHCFRYGTCAFRDLCVKDTPVRRAAFNARKPDYVDEAYQELAAKKTP